VYLNKDTGPITRELYNALTGIQTELAADVFGWMHPVNLDLNVN
jgi:hypothetical protein